MILSMTGYGKASAEYNNRKIHVEIKSLNSKALDFSTRIAPIYREKEMEIRKMVSNVLERGSILMSCETMYANSAIFPPPQALKCPHLPKSGRYLYDCQNSHSPMPWKNSATKSGKWSKIP